MLHYVMIDPGTPLPHVTAAPQTAYDSYGLGQDTPPPVAQPAAPTTSATAPMTAC